MKDEKEVIRDRLKAKGIDPTDQQIREYEYWALKDDLKKINSCISNSNLAKWK